MLSLEQLREIDPELKEVPDAELLEIRDSLYALGELMYDEWLEEKRGKTEQGWACGDLLTFTGWLC